MCCRTLWLLLQLGQARWTSRGGWPRQLFGVLHSLSSIIGENRVHQLQHIILSLHQDLNLKSTAVIKARVRTVDQGQHVVHAVHACHSVLEVVVHRKLALGPNGAHFRRLEQRFEAVER